MNQKGFVKDIIIVILALVVAGGVYIGYSKGLINFGSKKESSVTNETTDWKTYTNEKYGFEFKYPNNWAVSESQKPSLPYLVSISLGPKDMTEGGGFFAVMVRDQTEDQFLSSLSQGDYYIISKTDVAIGNKKAVLCIYGRNDSSDQWKSIVMQKEEYLFEFSSGATPYYGDIFNKMLPTFKFTN